MVLTASIGARPRGERLQRIESSRNWKDGRFVDVMQREEPQMWSAMREMIKGGSRYRKPSGEIPIVKREGSEFAALPSNGLRVTWLGHSTLLIEIDGLRALVDPVFGMRASPFAWAGPKRFHAPPLALADLPEIDVVVISHDHYDHLDYPTVVQLAQRELPFLAPLGVGAHLELWGVQPEAITELDWWQSYSVKGVELTAVPARHFSGRSPTMSDRDRTLWAGWAICGSDHRVYFSGDTAMFPQFEEIGKRLGPFDMAMIEAGAYNAAWRDVHIGPEQAVLASEMVQAKLLLPVHWGTFDLALHGWTEPIERIEDAAAKRNLKLTTPKPGESVIPGISIPTERWWPELEYQHAKDAPIVATGLDESIITKVMAL